MQSMQSSVHCFTGLMACLILEIDGKSQAATFASHFRRRLLASTSNLVEAFLWKASSSEKRGYGSSKPIRVRQLLSCVLVWLSASVYSLVCPVNHLDCLAVQDGGNMREPEQTMRPDAAQADNGDAVSLKLTVCAHRTRHSELMAIRFARSMRLRYAGTRK